MFKDIFALAVSACVLLGFAGSVVAQSNTGQESISLQAETLLAQERQLEQQNEQQQEAMRQQERQLEVARRRMEQARQQMEQAAEDVARATAEIGNGEHFVALNRQLRTLGGRARLGVNIEDHAEGVRVLGVTPRGPASRAGVQSGDVIVALDGDRLAEVEALPPSGALIDRLADIEPGSSVELLVKRGDADEEITVSVETDSMPGAFAIFTEGPMTMQNLDAGSFPGVAMPPGVFGRWRDMELVELTPELGAYFGTETGILVVRAPDDDALQLVDGDVIIDIGGRTPTSPEHAHRILRSFEAGEKLEIAIMRERRRRTLEFEVPRRQSRPGMLLHQ